MGLTDPVTMLAGAKGYTLIRGRETFFDENDEQRIWDSMLECRQWAIDNLGVDPLANLTEEKAERIRKSEAEPRQRRLF